ncbi:MAG: hypothetical protein ACOC95_05590 [Planctomycetota bacterium]
MKYAKPTVHGAQALRIARKHRRLKRYWELYRSIGQGDPGFMGGVQALFGMLFPVTYPLYLLFSRPYSIAWMKLVLWPFYQVSLNLSYPRGVKKDEVWVEAIAQGLLCGHNWFGHGIWYPKSIPEAATGIADDPLMARPKHQLNVRKVVDGEPPRDALLVEHALRPEDAAEYVISAAEEDDTPPGIINPPKQFALAFRGDVTDLRAIEVDDVVSVFYPLWVVEYRRKDVKRVVAFSGTRRWYFRRIDVTDAVMQNPDLSQFRRA